MAEVPPARGTAIVQTQLAMAIETVSIAKIVLIVGIVRIVLTVLTAGIAQVRKG